MLTEPRYTGWLPADVGLRDIDRGERVMLQQLGITAFTMREIDKHGIAKVMELSLAQLVNSSDSSLHVSFDIDALCPTWSGLTSQTLVFSLIQKRNVLSRPSPDSRQKGKGNLLVVARSILNRQGAEHRHDCLRRPDDARGQLYHRIGAHSVLHYYIAMQ